MKILRIYHKKIRNLKIRHKMIVVSIGLVLMVGLISIAGYQISLEKYDRLLYKQTSSTLSLFSQQIRLGMMTIEELSNRSAINAIIQDNLMQLSQTDDDVMSRYRAKYNITQELHQYLTPNILCISIILDDGSSIICGLDSSKELEHIIESGKEISKQSNGVSMWMTNDREDNSVLLVKEIRKTNEPYFLKSLGYIFFRVNFDRIVNQHSINTEIMDKQLVTIFDDDGYIFYSTHNLSATDTQKFQAINEYSIQEINNDKLFISKADLKSTNPDLSIFAGLKYEDVFYSIMQTKALAFFVIIIAIFLSVAIAGIVVRDINSRFVLLVNKIGRFKSGNLELLSNSKQYGNDEFGLLNQYFDELVVELKAMIDDNYVKQLLIAQSQLKNLEHQIHPHFLYNTLETVRWFAKRSGEERIPIIVDALSTLLRNNLTEKEDVVTLKQELSVLENYIAIQKIRYTDILEVIFDIDPRTLEAKIPKISIQPLVENAITYSMEESIDDCKIIVSSRINGTEIIIAVKNNNSQIEEDILDKLKCNNANAHGHGIGLVNIDSRLKLLFGETYGLQFINGEDSVTVEIHLPSIQNGIGEGRNDNV